MKIFELTRIIPGWCAVISALVLVGSRPGLWAAAAGTLSESWSRIAPPPGLAIADEARRKLTEETVRLGREIEVLQYRLREQPALLELLPDVQVFHKAVDWALRYDEFFRTNEVAIARGLLAEGQRRVEQLREGKAPWTTATGLVVRGYLSRLDGSVQPYGLVVPASGVVDRSRPCRLDVWLHGRDNSLTELKFIADRQRSVGEFAPADAIVLHPYGRYCNAFKFAGETDVLEAVDAVQRQYAVDPDRRVLRGFSMGGAGCWHLAVHHAGFWVAAAPGAGFAETASYTGAFRRIPWPRDFEQRLWNWYDATAWAGNLRHCPTIAYSGALDKQKQAADVMADAMRAEGLELTHVIGPGVEHRYEPGAKKEVARLVDEMAAAGRGSEPDHVRFITWTLRYHRLHWVSVEGLEEHWKRAVIDARRMARGFQVSTENINRCALRLPDLVPALGGAVRAGGGPTGRREVNVLIDGQALVAELPERVRDVHLVRRAGVWRQVVANDDGALRKRPGLQGPIDDAFMDRFLFVRPTGRPWNPAVGAWVETALARATNEWRAQFRGEVPVKDDRAVTPEDIATHHLIVWGDPRSNRLLGRMAGAWPLRWNERRMELAGRGFPVATAVPVFIYPNPLNPSRYVVVNSGFTFWQSGDASNAQQTPKLPDYAVLDVSVASELIPTRGVMAAGFFDELWGWPSLSGRRSL